MRARGEKKKVIQVSVCVCVLTFYRRQIAMVPDTLADSPYTDDLYKIGPSSGFCIDIYTVCASILAVGYILLSILCAAPETRNIIRG